GSLKCKPHDPGGEPRALEWGLICTQGLAWYFQNHVPGARERPLRVSDFSTFAEDESLWRGVGSPLQSAELQGLGRRELGQVLIERAQLAVFWEWLWAAVGVLQETGIWAPGRGFEGFVDKRTAQSLLARALPGTFLFRLSSTNPGCLAVHYASSSSETGIRDVLVQVDGAGLHCVVGGRMKNYSNLDELVLSVEKLRLLHPNTPKRNCFHASSMSQGRDGNGHRSRGGYGGTRRRSRSRSSGRSRGGGNEGGQRRLSSLGFFPGSGGRERAG
ncbi:unnamed protein product, partial [Discosporangium mesarthrocarpum]